ncbi:hypothetical protein HPB49_016519 [Dermacentor silvarum]|uniref:Uncharacterized protein n=1 Tax=Dermacentor silvarum TaxID=543639 RepID=A0ACB8DEF8_DERSI|nr:hypothetical protein HPB49_016519 [Dermacentor silvarum]
MLTQAHSSDARGNAAELEVFLGGRSLPAAALVVSVVASVATAIILVGFVGHYYAYGFHVAWCMAGIPVASAVAAIILVPLLYDLRVASIFQGGFRAVVWADVIQASVMFFSPLLIIGKVAYDSRRVHPPLRPLSDFNVTEYAFR